MVEKNYEKLISLTAPQSSYTRVANRMLKEYKEAHGESDEEIKQIAEKIKKCEEVDYSYDTPIELNGDEHRIYDKLRISYDDNISCGIDYDEYNEPYYYVHWYFFESTWYTKWIGGEKISAGDYHEMLKKVTEVKGEYRYFCLHRPPASYCLPDGYISYDTYAKGCRHIGEVTYNRELTYYECKNWGLMLDKEWAEQRKAILESE